MSKKTLLIQYQERTDRRTDIIQSTRDQYKRDARKMLETDDLLYGPGYRTVRKELFKLIEQRFREKKIRA